MEIQDIHNFMLLHNVKWRFEGDELHIPSPADIELVLDKMRATLYDSEPGTQVEVGGLLVKQEPDCPVDVYVRIGELDE